MPGRTIPTKLPGTLQTLDIRRKKSGRRHQTSWGSTICLETCGSGAVTGLETTPVRHRQTRIITVVPSGFFVAAAGTTMRRTHVWLIAATTRLLARTTTSASVLQGRCPDYTLAFLLRDDSARVPWKLHHLTFLQCFFCEFIGHFVVRIPTVCLYFHPLYRETF